MKYMQILHFLSSYNLGHSCSRKYSAIARLVFGCVQGKAMAAACFNVELAGHSLFKSSARKLIQVTTPSR